MPFNGDKFYVTTPIYYVNDKPHIGHAYTTVAADAVTRYTRISGGSAFFLTGVDEHGQKVAKAAAAAGIDPLAHCDRMAARFKDLWKLLDIDNSAFIRTTDDGHKRVVAEFMSEIMKRGLIEKREFEGWYCTPCERYWTEKDLEEKNCPDCKRPVERFTEPDYYFLMAKFSDRLKTIIESDEVEIIPRNRKNEVLGFIEKGIGDLCISRPKHRLSWGIPIPFDEEYVTYVWFDALINYYSATKYLAPEGSSWWPCDAHFIGKDILTTHSVYWLTMLLAMDLPLPKRIVAHGWWKCGGEKMSKSLGNVVDPVWLVERYQGADTRTAVDAFRYFLLSEVPFGLDGTFSLEAYERRWTSDLSNDIGNLLRRVTSLIDKILGGAVEARLGDGDDAVIAEYAACMESFQFSRAAECFMAFTRSINQYIQEKAPWARPADVGEVLGRAAAALRLVASMAYPFMPRSAALMAHALGADTVPTFAECVSSVTITTREIGPLFSRPEQREERVEEKNANEEKKSDHVYASIDDVKRLGLKVGEVITAERVEKTKKLLKLTVDIGGERRSLIAGIAEAYAPESLIGRKVVVVTNLAPAVIRGIESQGMILAASAGDVISLVAPGDPLPAGSEVR